MAVSSMENIMRLRFKADNHFAQFRRHALTCTQIERHASPAPVVNVHLNRNKGFSFAVRTGTLFFQVTRRGLAGYKTAGVLTTHSLFLNITDIDFSQCFKHLQLLITDAVSIEPGWWFHCN